MEKLAVNMTALYLAAKVSCLTVILMQLFEASIFYFALFQQCYYANCYINFSIYHYSAFFPL